MSLGWYEFSKIALELDERNDKYERVVKLARDIVIESKRIISVLHRQYKKDKSLDDVHERLRKDETLNEAQGRLIKLRKYKFYPLAKELQKEDPYYFIRAYSFGLQEYIEAVSFWNYLSFGTLVSLDEVQDGLTFEITSDDQTKYEENNICKKDNKVLLKVFVPEYDFLLGMLDLGGEMMRACVSAVAANDTEFTKRCCRLVQDLLCGVEACNCWRREFSSKVSVLRISTGKMERCCYQLAIRDSFELKKPTSFLLAGRNQKDVDAYDSGYD